MPRSNTPKLLSMMQQLVAIPSMSSVNPSFDTGNRRVIDQLATWLDGLGFHCDIQTIHNNPNKANLIATLGQGDNGLIFSGHTDTVPYDEGRWSQDPFSLTEKNNRYYGLGSTDMKCFIAMAIEAAKSLDAKKLKQPLTIVATADEESTMDGAKLIAANGKKLGRYCLIGEPTNLQPVRMHKGIMMESIKLTGQSGHSSDPALGNNALEGMYHVIAELLTYRNELQEKFHNKAFVIPVPTLNLGHIHGGDNPNRICPDCELHIDLRPLPGMPLAELRNDIHQRVKRITDLLNLQVEFTPLFDGIPAMETDEASAIIQACEKLAKAKAESVAFGTEAPYFNQLGTETIVMGPGSIDQAHQPDEYIESHAIQPTVKLLQTLAHQFCD